MTTVQLLLLIVVIFECAAATRKQKSQNIFRQFLCCFRPSSATVQQQNLPLPTTASDENGSATKVTFKLFNLHVYTDLVATVSTRYDFHE